MDIVAPADVSTRRRSLDVRSASYAHLHTPSKTGDVEGGGAGIQRATTEFGEVSGGMDVAVKVRDGGLEGALVWRPRRRGLGAGGRRGRELAALSLSSQLSLSRPAFLVVRPATVWLPSPSLSSRPHTHATPLHLHPKDLTYTVANRAHTKGNPASPARLALLANVTTSLLPAQLAALVGPSGSGKSTLLDLLAGRKTVGTITSGVIRYAGQAASVPFLRKYTGYCEQDDTLLANLTVSEMIAYTAALKLPRGVSSAARAARVNAVIDSLALAGCRDVRIGSVLARGISGGQAKRVNIGLALVSRPKVLFLDEPTSGLDSYTSNKVMDIVASLARSGLTVCATVHSPTSHIYGLFDRLTMLAAGRVLWSGAAGSAPITFLEGALPEVPRFMAGGGGDRLAAPQGAGQAVAVSDNAAEWLVDVTTAADRDGRAGVLADAFAASPAAAVAAKEVDGLLSSARPPLPASAAAALATKSATTTPAWWGVWTLLTHRGARDMRSPEFLGPRIGDKVFVAILIAALYSRLGTKGPVERVAGIPALLFLQAIMPGFAAAAFMPSLFLERALYVRERNDGLYRPATYLVSKLLVEVAVVFLISIPTAALIFYVCALEGYFIIFWLIYLLTSLCGLSCGYFVASLAPTMDAANAALPTYVTALLFFAGYTLRRRDQPVWLRWFGWTNFLMYAWNALMLNNFSGEPGLLGLDGTPVLEFYDVVPGPPLGCHMAMLALFACLFSALAWAGLAFKRLQQR